MIILIIGGLTLGLVVKNSGLDGWFGELIDFETISLGFFVAIFCYMVVAISNFMSNTATTNIVLPPLVALCASFAMMFPVSTPPNTVIYCTKVLQGRDFLEAGRCWLQS